MNSNQLAGLMITLFLAGLGVVKYYLDAKIDPLYKIADRLDKRDESLNRPSWFLETKGKS